MTTKPNKEMKKKKIFEIGANHLTFERGGGGG